MTYLLSLSTTKAVLKLPKGLARSADAFVDGIGINKHGTYGDTRYSEFESLVLPALLDLGVRHARDAFGFGVTDYAVYKARFQTLAQNGIKLLFYHDPRYKLPDGTPVYAQNGAEFVAMLKDVGVSAFDMVEGPNELDHDNPQYPDRSFAGQQFPASLKPLMTDLYQAIKGDPATAHLKVIAPAPQLPQNVDAIFAATGVLDCDYGGMHPYAALVQQHIETPLSGLDQIYIPKANLLSGNKPIVCTEVGFSYNNVPYQVVAKYMLRVLCEYWNRGIVRTYLYGDLLDAYGDPGTGTSWGLIDYTGNKKPTFHALKHLIHILKEPGANFTPAYLHYSLSDTPATVHRTLLQKSNGNFYLILWNEVLSYDYNNGNPAPRTIAPINATVTLHQPFAQARLYTPYSSGNALDVISNPTVLNVEIPDHPLIIELLVDPTTAPTVISDPPLYAPPDSASVPDVNSIAISSPTDGATLGFAPTTVEITGSYTSTTNVFAGIRARFNNGDWVNLFNPTGGSYSIVIPVDVAATGLVEVQFIDNPEIADSVSITIPVEPTPPPPPDPSVFTPVEPQGASSKLVAPAASTSTSSVASSDFTQTFPRDIVETEAPVVLQSGRSYAIATTPLTQGLEYAYYANAGQDLVTGTAPTQLTDGSRPGFAFQPTPLGNAITPASSKHYLRMANTATALRGTATDFTLMFFGSVNELAATLSLFSISKQDNRGGSGIRFVTKPDTEYTTANSPSIRNYSLRTYN
jgi:hypothetical protein